MTSSRSISDAVNSGSTACGLSRDGLMDARLGVVDIAIILSLICIRLASSVQYRDEGRQVEWMLDCLSFRR